MITLTIQSSKNSMKVSPLPTNFVSDDSDKKHQIFLKMKKENEKRFAERFDSERIDFLRRV